MRNRLCIIITLLLPLVCCALKPPSPQVEPGGVRFSFYAPSATSIAVAGSFNHWDTEHDQLRGPDGKGIWTILLPLSEGRYEYRFVIDKREWALDPSMPTMDDELGEKNSIITVLP